MIGPFATDMYAPGFPQIERELQASPSSVQLTLSLFMLGMGVGQLFWGPLSDIAGRRGPLLIASTLLVVSSFAAAAAPSIGWLVVWRFVQGFTGCAGVVISRAIPRDLSSGRELARAFGLLGVIQGIAPVLAPVLGGVVVSLLGWRAVLWAILGVAVLMLLGVLLRVHESLPTTARQRLTVSTLAQTVRDLLHDHIFLGATLTIVFSFGVLFAYIAGSSFFLQHQYGLGTIPYTLCFAGNAIGMLLAGTINRRALSVHSPAQLQTIFTSIVVVSSLGLLALVAFLSKPPLAVVLVLILVASAAVVPSMANLTTLAMQSRTGSDSGMASAIMGALQFLGAGAVTVLVSLNGSPTVRSISLVMGVAAIGAALCLFLIVRPQRMAE
ncbi:MAG: multidrug effflux MFS transporter [Microbacteriaceae bacterium]|jgi:DHA1 family bicyclomycin/chloramphenicol resistance-like MFS transporter|nr:multidrug effflux MFS transporter [Microbacteriaceae bacterium]